MTLAFGPFAHRGHVPQPLRDQAADGGGFGSFFRPEFHQIGHDIQTRALLLPEQVQIEDGSLFAAAT